jgi:opine dehydrogenase
MLHTLKFAVLGSGHGGRAVCGQIAEKKYPVIMYEPLEETADYLRLKKEKEIFLQGDITAGGKLHDVTMDMGKAVFGADIILVVVPSFAHAPIFEKLIPKLVDGQHVVIFPGNYGGLRLKKMMVDRGVSKNIFISETVSLPYACRITAFNTVNIYKKKARLKMASSPFRKRSEAISAMNDVFSGAVEFFPGNNLLETGLDNLNQTLHPFPVLLNYGAIEKNPATFRHYMDGITPLISDLMMQMDQERLSIGKAFSLKLISTLDQLKMYYGQNSSKTYYEYVNSPQSPYVDVVGHNVKSRYLTEDVPGLNVAALQLAAKVGVKAPIVELVIGLASLLHGVDYLSKGTRLETLGIADKTPEQILELTS